MVIERRSFGVSHCVSTFILLLSPFVITASVTASLPCIFANIFPMSAYNDPKELSLEKLYDAGLFVFGGWHEMVALQNLHENLPLYKPPFSQMPNCQIYIFPERTEEISRNLRITGASQNRVEEVRQMKDFLDIIQHMRRQFLYYGKANPRSDKPGTMPSMIKVSHSFPIH